MTSKTIPLVFLVVLLIVAPLSVCFVRQVRSTSQTWTVDRNGLADFHTIQEAVNAANPGDTIYVYNGSYNENIVLNKTVSLVGQNKATTVINGLQSGNTLWISADNATVTGFTIQGSDNYGIYLSGTKNTRVHDNLIKNNHYGIFSTWSSNNFIYNNTVVGNTVGVEINDSTGFILRNNNMTSNKYNFGVWGHELQTFIHDIDTSNKVDAGAIYYLVTQKSKEIPPGAGYVAVVNSTNIAVKNLVLTKNAAGVLLAYSTQSIVHNVSVIGDSNGVELVYSSRNTVSQNTFATNDLAILSYYSDNNTISENILLNNDRGIGLDQTDDTLVTRNSLENGTLGIMVTDGRDNVISGNTLKKIAVGSAISIRSGNTTVAENTISSSATAISIYNYPNSAYEVYHNNFMNNTKQLQLLSAPSITWDDGYPAGGNYWLGYMGVDLRSGPAQNLPGNDGIGDASYFIDGNNRDTYPLMQPYNGPVRNTRNGRSYPTIQEAVDNAMARDTIRVFSGVYYEHLILNKALSLVGENHMSTIIDGNGTGTVAFISADNVSINELTMTNSGLGQPNPRAAIRLSTAAGLNLSNSVLANSEYGIWFDSGANHAQLVNNNVMDNKIGAYVSSTAFQNRIYHNNFVNNTVQALSLNSNNVWDNGCEGNYWNDYNGTDVNGDGVGDTNLPWSGVDHYPLMNRFWNIADVNHDMKVDIKDLGVAAVAYGSYVGQSAWNPHVDLTGPVLLMPDGRVDIRDLALIAVNYGKTWIP